MFGVNSKRRQGKHHAKTTLQPIPLPAPLPVQAPPEIYFNPPPPYALVCPLRQHLPQELPLPPVPPRRPTTTDDPTTKIKPHCSRPAVVSKPRKKSTALVVSKPASHPRAIGKSSHDSGEAFDGWYGNAVEPVPDTGLCDAISSKFDSVITSIDGEVFSGNREELEINDEVQLGLRGGWGSASREVSRRADRAISSAVTSTNYFSKVHLYANSRLPPNLPPLTL